ncbi:MAG: class I SAM-dependent methyltransferase [Bacteroidota bacterium]
MKDNFSNNSAAYALFRPNYPDTVFRHILQFVTTRNNAWDCATGNGQAAKELAAHFTTVYATDISENQISNAVQKDNIIYKIEPAEKTGFPGNFFDLVVVAQAIHWFNFDQFYSEVKRTTKEGGVLAIIGYGNIETDGELNKSIKHFYTKIVGPYWDKERRYIDESYQTIPFPFAELTATTPLLKYEWTFEQLTGYFNTWSAVQHYIKANNENPVATFSGELKNAWKNERTREFSFPILMRIGRIHK